MLKACNTAKQSVRDWLMPNYSESAASHSVAQHTLVGGENLLHEHKANASWTQGEAVPAPNCTSARAGASQSSPKYR